MAAYSTDGVIWQKTAMPRISSQRWDKLIFGNGLFIAISESNNIIAKTSDGMIWELETVYQVGTAATYGAGYFVTNSSVDGQSLLSQCAAGPVPPTPTPAPTTNLYAAGFRSVGGLELGVPQSFVPSIPSNYTYFAIDTGSTWSYLYGSTDVLFAIKGGELWACGRNTNGQLGDGTNLDYIALTQIGLDTDWSSIVTNGLSTLAIKGGELWVTGANTYGTLGLGSNVQIDTFTQVGSDTNWSAVSVGSYGNAYAIKGAGNNLYAAGSNWYGELGNGTNNSSNTFALINSDSWISIAALKNGFLGVKSNGTLWAAGDAYVPSTTIYPGFNRLGTGYSAASNTLVQVGSATNWSSVYAAENGAFAIKTDNTLWATGLNATLDSDGSFSQLGIDPATAKGIIQFTQVGTSTDWSNVCSDPTQGAIAIKTDGTVWGTGSNVYGQLGQGNTTPVGPQFTQLLSSTGWSMAANLSYGTVILNASLPTPTPTPTPTPVTTTYSNLYGAGYNQNYQLGIETFAADQTEITFLASSNYQTISCSKYCSVGLQYDLTESINILYGTGANTFGNLGLSSTTNPVINTFEPLSDKIQDWAKVVTSDSGHTLLINQNGELYATGNNDRGQLGNSLIGGTVEAITLIDDTASFWLEVTATNNRSYAIVSGNNLMAWGAGANGWLGLGSSTSDISIPTLINSLNMAGWSSLAVGSGANHMIAIASDGSLWGWGSNNHGQLGLNDNTDRYVPTLIDNSNTWIYVAVGKDFTVAVKSDNTVWGCGVNALYQMGIDGDTNDKLVLNQIPLFLDMPPIIYKVAAGESSVVALDAAGKIFGWGGNTYGELGDGTKTPITTPIELTINTTTSPISNIALSKQLIVIVDETVVSS